MAGLKCSNMGCVSWKSQMGTCWGAMPKEQGSCGQCEKAKTKAKTKIGGIMNVGQWDSGWQTLSKNL